MNLQLDYEQRVYLYLMLGNLECRTVGETRAAWELMDRLGLNEHEKQAINFQMKIVDQQEAYSWDQSLAAPSNGLVFDVSESDIKRLSQALQSCPKFLPRQARRWLEPLLRQLPQLEDTTNGTGTKS